jgi:hypothetical protein
VAAVGCPKLDAISKQRRSPTFIVIAKLVLSDFLSEIGAAR